MRQGILIAIDVFFAGFAPFAPWLDYLYSLMSEREIPIEMFYEMGLAWLRASDAVLVLPYTEYHKGVVAEVEEAKRLGIPVFETITELVQYRDDGMF